MRNAIKVSRYIYNAEIRKRYRENMGISDDEYLIGSVGRLAYPKNQEFLIEVFSEICKKNIENGQKYRLLLVGTGEREREYKKIVGENEFGGRVIFTGHREDVPELLQMMDVFCLPSLFEGLPMSLVEAQASGLTCIASDCITKEADITGNIYYKRLDKHEWADCILDISKDLHDRKNEKYEEILESEYNITNQISKVERLYMEGFHEKI